MKNQMFSSIFVCIVLLSGCARTTVNQYSSPPHPVIAHQGQKTEEKNPDLPIHRAEIAQLLHTHLFQQERSNSNSPAQKNTFKTPDELQGQTTSIMPDDVKTHLLSLDIKIILSYNFRGFTVDKNNKFHPDIPLSRAEFALLAEDIWAFAAKDNSLSSRYIGSVSPFVDVNDDYFALNAIISVTAGKIMSPDNDSRFRPEAPITRAEALYGISVLQQTIE